MPDISTFPFVTHSPSNSFTGRTGGAQTIYNPYSNVYDGNSGTYYGAYWDWTGDDGRTVLTTVGQSTWTQSLRLNNFYALSYLYQQSDGDAYNPSTQYVQMYTEFLISGVWTLVNNQVVYTPSSHGGSYATNFTWNGTTGWNNVTGTRVTLVNTRPSISSEYNPGQHIRLQNLIYTITPDAGINTGLAFIL